MDIPDVEIVVVFGVPDTVSQFYQVELLSTYYVHVVKYTCIVCSFVEELVVVVAKQEHTFSTRQRRSQMLCCSSIALLITLRIA